MRRRTPSAFFLLLLPNASPVVRVWPGDEVISKSIWLSKRLEERISNPCPLKYVSFSDLNIFAFSWLAYLTRQSKRPSLFSCLSSIPSFDVDVIDVRRETTLSRFDYKATLFILDLTLRLSTIIILHNSCQWVPQIVGFVALIYLLKAKLVAANCQC